MCRRRTPGLCSALMKEAWGSTWMQSSQCLWRASSASPGVRPSGQERRKVRPRARSARGTRRGPRGAAPAATRPGGRSRPRRSLGSRSRMSRASFRRSHATSRWPSLHLEVGRHQRQRSNFPIEAGAPHHPGWCVRSISKCQQVVLQTRIGMHIYGNALTGRSFQAMWYATRSELSLQR